MTSVSAPSGEAGSPELFTDDGLVGGECGTCGRRHFPLAEWCPWCGEPDPVRVQLSRHGTLWSWTSVLTAPPGYEGEVPYGFGVVELDAEGLHVVTRLTEADPERLRVGRSMIFRIVALDAHRSTWAFAPR